GGVPAPVCAPTSPSAGRSRTPALSPKAGRKASPAGHFRLAVLHCGRVAFCANPLRGKRGQKSVRARGIIVTPGIFMLHVKCEPTRLESGQDPSLEKANPSRGGDAKPTGLPEFRRQTPTGRKSDRPLTSHL